MLFAARSTMCLTALPQPHRVTAVPIGSHVTALAGLGAALAAATAPGPGTGTGTRLPPHRLPRESHLPHACPVLACPAPSRGREGCSPSPQSPGAEMSAPTLPWLPPSAGGHVPSGAAVGAGDIGCIQPAAILTLFPAPAAGGSCQTRGPRGSCWSSAPDRSPRLQFTQPAPGAGAKLRSSRVRLRAGDDFFFPLQMIIATADCLH